MGVYICICGSARVFMYIPVDIYACVYVRILQPFLYFPMQSLVFPVNKIDISTINISYACPLMCVVRVCACACVYIYIYIYIYGSARVCMYIPVDVICTCVCKNFTYHCSIFHIYIYIYIYIYI